jgi:molybdenum cofactor cytidylyltransferase
MNQKSPRINLSAIILAAGKSVRTSPTNKLLLPFRRKDIIRIVADGIMSINFKDVLVVTGFEEDRIRTALQGYPVRFIHNADFDEGMGVSIRTGVTHSRPETDGYMIVLGDMPWIDRTVLKIMIQSFYTNPDSAVVVPVYKSRRGNPVIFSRKYRDNLSKLSGDSGARSVIQEFENQVIEVPAKNERLLMDIDTVKDYENRNQNP